MSMAVPTAVIFENLGIIILSESRGFASKGHFFCSHSLSSCSDAMYQTQQKENRIEIINFYVNHTFIFKLKMLYKLQII